jgi:hypothetical protein
MHKSRKIRVRCTRSEVLTATAFDRASLMILRRASQTCVTQQHKEAALGDV